MPTGKRTRENTMSLRVPKAKLDTGLSETMIKQFGVVPEPLEATWHNLKVSQDSLEFGSKVGEWDAADESLKSFAHMAVAAPAVSLVVENGQVTRIYVMRNPRKLTRLDEPAQLAR
jgi:hypothetical protein